MHNPDRVDLRERRFGKRESDIRLTEVLAGDLGKPPVELGLRRRPSQRVFVHDIEQRAVADVAMIGGKFRATCERVRYRAQADLSSSELSQPILQTAGVRC